MIRFACPACKATINAPDQLAGKQARCPGCKGTVAVPMTASNVQAQAPAPAASNFEELDNDDAEATSHPPKSRAKLVAWFIGIGSVVGLLGMCVCGGVGWFMLSKSGGSLGGKLLANDDQSLVLAYLDKNLNNPDGLEVVEWKEPKKVYILPPKKGRERTEEEILKGIMLPEPPKPDKSQCKPGTVLHLKFRTQSVLGKTLHEHVFLVSEGKVISSRDVNSFDLRDVPYKLRVEHSINWLGRFWDD